jgi:hypothetical protein
MGGKVPGRLVLEMHIDQAVRCQWYINNGQMTDDLGLSGMLLCEQKDNYLNVIMELRTEHCTTKHPATPSPGTAVAIKTCKPYVPL